MIDNRLRKKLLTLRWFCFALFGKFNLVDVCEPALESEKEWILKGSDYLPKET